MIQGSWKRHGEGFVLSLAMSQKNGTPKIGTLVLITKKDGSIGFFTLTEKVGEHTSNGVQYGLFQGAKYDVLS
jgi:hypothetical protein